MIYVKNNFGCCHNSVVYDTNVSKFFILKTKSLYKTYIAIPFQISKNFSIKDEYNLTEYKEDEFYDHLISIGNYDDLVAYWKSCAMSAMQGYQESSGKVGIAADLLHKETAKLSFQMADTMLEEYMKRLVS